MKTLQVYIMTHNRPNSILNSINSVLSQTFTNFELIISDNSTNDITKEVLEKEYPHQAFKYIKRNPPVERIKHLNLILSEITAAYFVIFHDDDVMHPTMLETLYKALKSSPKVLAAAPNAFIIRNEKAAGYALNYKKNIYIKSNTELAKYYLQDKNIAPFSSYMYKKEIQKFSFFNLKNGGKYADVSFLMEIAKHGEILLLNEPLIDHHIYSGQDNGSNEFIHRNTLISYIIRTTKYNRKDHIVKKYRVMNLYNEICKMKHEKNLTYSFSRLSKIYFIIFAISPFNYFPKLIVRYIINYW